MYVWWCRVVCDSVCEYVYGALSLVAHIECVSTLVTISSLGSAVLLCTTCLSSSRVSLE